MSKRARTSISAAAHTRMRRRIRHHYYRIMPDRVRVRAIIWTIFWIAAGVIVVQLIYPPTRTLPLAYWQGQQRGYNDELLLAADIKTVFDSTKVRFVSGEKSVEVSLGALGAEPQTAAAINIVSDYPFWQRYIPLSIFWPRYLSDVPVTYTNAIANPACEKYATELSYPATDASLRLEGGRLVATDDVDGARVDAGQLCQQIQSHAFHLGGVVELSVDAEPVVADKTSADFTSVMQHAQVALERQITFMHDGKAYTPADDVRAGWLSLGTDESGVTILGVDDGAIRAYLTDINKEVGQAPGQTNVRIVNGREDGRDIGASGREIDYIAVIERTREQLLSQALLQPIQLALRDIEPTIVYNSRYTATQDGLRAYVTDAARQYNARISIQQLDGPGWQAAAREHESIPSASTYKLYVAMRLFDDMKNGHTSWDDSILDTTVSVCFDRMTIASTNACSEEWIRRYGRAALNQYLYDHGFSQGTTFTSSVAVHTTAADLTSYMVRLARGQLYDDVFKQRLLQSLGGHPFPFGIPAGSKGRVYDKVGFLWDYVHDTAIVEHSSGRYVLTIMTKGQSYARIASITREVERIMYP